MRGEESLKAWLVLVFFYSNLLDGRRHRRLVAIIATETSELR